MIFAKNNAPDLLCLAGSVSITGGVAMVYLPAGIITGGLFALVAGVIMARVS